MSALVLGLGNPGSRYAFTRHNIGFLVLDIFAQEAGAAFRSDSKYKGEHSKFTLEGNPVELLKPQTYMNLSGETLQAFYQKNNHYRKEPLIIVHDEVDLPFGRMKLKFAGGDAGHNGLKSIRGVLGHGDYHRLRMGVGRPPAGSPIELADYVLDNFPQDSHENLVDFCLKAAKVLELFVAGKEQAAQELAASNGI